MSKAKAGRYQAFAAGQMGDLTNDAVPVGLMQKLVSRVQKLR